MKKLEPGCDRGEGVTDRRVKAILARMHQGAELHRIASEREGHYWMLMPGSERVPNAIAEAVVSEPRVVAEGAPVGRVSWTFKDRMVAKAQRLGEKAGAESTAAE